MMAIEERTIETSDGRPIPAVPMELELDTLKQCVRCGLCLDYCPTYRALGVEMDSPRGRIYQVKAVYEGKISPEDPHFRKHIYQCLDCRACETACPSGVQYGKIVEAARGVAEPDTAGEQTIGRTVLNRIFTSNTALDLLGFGLRAYQKIGAQGVVRKSGLLKLLPDRLATMEGMLAPTQGGVAKPGLPELVRAHGPRRYRVGFIAGCVMPQFLGETNQASIRVLARNGCDVYTPRAQGCCGALHVHTGERDTARQLARRNVEVFEPLGLDAIIINAAGCGSTLKEYGHLFERDPLWRDRAKAFSGKVKDINEWLAEIGIDTAGLGEVRARVTYQDPCHLVHGQGIRNQPRQLLQAIPGVDFVELKDSDVCCGSAGIYNLTHPELSGQILDWKIPEIAKTGARILVAPNPGCAMQIAYGARQHGLDLEVLHVVDLLDRAYRAGDRTRRLGPGDGGSKGGEVDGTRQEGALRGPGTDRETGALRGTDDTRVGDGGQSVRGRDIGLQERGER
jgi:glycolate oxidase iron-sulfur subunit